MKTAAILLLFLVSNVAEGQIAPDSLPQNQHMLNFIFRYLGLKVGSGLCSELITRPLGLSADDSSTWVADKFGNTLVGECIDSAEIQPGDIVLYSGMVDDSGKVLDDHVAIIYSVFENGFLVAEQNVEEEQCRSRVVINHPISIEDGFSSISYSFYRPWPKKWRRKLPEYVEMKMKAISPLGQAAFQTFHSSSYEYVFDMDNWPNNRAHVKNEEATIYVDLDSCLLIVDCPSFPSIPIRILSVQTDTIEGAQWICYKLDNMVYPSFAIHKERNEGMLDAINTRLNPVFIFKNMELVTR